MMKSTVQHGDKRVTQRFNRDMQELFILKENGDEDQCNSRTEINEVSSSERTVLFTLHISHGFYAGASFKFVLSVPPSFPFTAPSLTTTQIIYHPNISLLTGSVFIPIDWSPVVTLCSVVCALKV